MLAALQEQLTTLSHKINAPARASGMPALGRTFSVGYLEEKILPAVKAVHTAEYIQSLADKCVSLRDAEKPKPDAVSAIDGDTDYDCAACESVMRRAATSRRPTAPICANGRSSSSRDGVV